MPDESAWNAYIFRDGKQERRGSEFVEQLTASLVALRGVSGVERRTRLIDTLILAGELECALFDAKSETAGQAASITDLLAEALVANQEPNVNGCLTLLDQIAPPDTVQVAVPEGFAYYALHPLKFADLASQINTSGDVLGVVGIRSIGTTLSAVVRAALRVNGKKAERITVRPTGHPYDRETRLTPEQQAWLAKMISLGSQLLVVDEGPGMSGSSFLSVGEALISTGAARDNISFLCSRVPDVAALKATDAQARWPLFTAHYIDGTSHLPAGAERYVGGGIWRGDVFVNEAEWPASWTMMERAKFQSSDGNVFYKFEGFGTTGADVHERALKVAEAGFGPMPLRRDEGYGVYRVVPGRTLNAENVTPALLRHIAEYCAFRAENIPAKAVNQGELEHMVSFNAQQEFGPDTELSCRLAVVRPVVTDSRMAPHKWIDADGRWLKVDSATHGDDHFFPGPTDIAWDLAGTIIEWELDDDAAHFLLNCYRRASGDDAVDRVTPYLFAYAVFRMSYWKMASAAMRGTFEAERLTAAYQRFRQYAAKFLPAKLAIEQSKAAEVRVA